MNKSLSILFKRLNSIVIKYFLLTDFECDLLGKDIDLFVHSDCKDLFEKTLVELGWYKRKEPAHHLNHHFYYSSASDIYLDVKYELEFANGDYNCYSYINSSEVIASTTLNVCLINRPQGIHAIILYAAHLAYKERGKLEQKHKSYLTSYITDFSQSNDSVPDAIKEMTRWLENSFPNNLQNLQKILSPYFKYDQKKMVRNKTPLKYGFGVKVLFLGTDGSGKTTLIDAVEKQINLKTNKIYLGTGENGWTSPIIKKIYAFKFKMKLLNKLFSGLKTYIVLPFEFIFRMLRAKTRSKYSVVLIDRFPGTIFLDKKSIRKAIYNFILPRPDIVFFIYADLEVLIKRKPTEVTLEGGKADILKFQKVADIVSGGNYVSIDTSDITIADARDLIISEIYKSSKVYNNLLAKLN